MPTTQKKGILIQHPKWSGSKVRIVQNPEHQIAKNLNNVWAAAIKTKPKKLQEDIGLEHPWLRLKVSWPTWTWFLLIKASQQTNFPFYLVNIVTYSITLQSTLDILDDIVFKHSFWLICFQGEVWLCWQIRYCRRRIEYCFKPSSWGALAPLMTTDFSATK